MSANNENGIIDEIEKLLKDLDLGTSYELKSVEKDSAHSKVIDAFIQFWNTKYEYFERYGQQDVDFMGKDGRPEGHIILAMEVDARASGGLKNCVKLANIRSENKIWIHISSSGDAKENFDKSLVDIRRLLTIRKETKETFGNFVAFLKTPEDLQKVVLL